MTLTPSKHRPLSRQPSSPSLAVGLPPPLPESNIMTPSSSSRNLKRSRSQHRVHRGDVSSSAASSPYNTEDEDAHDRITPINAGGGSRETTPKRKVVNTIEPVTLGRPKTVAKRTTLQERLQAAAKVKKSRSTGDGLGESSIPPVPSIPSSHSKARITAIPSVVSGLSSESSVTDSKDKNDKVVVCVRIKPTSSPFSNTAYEVTPVSLTLSDAHPNVQKRGGKAGREEEYTYTFDKLLQYPATTPDLYTSKVAPLVEKAMNGFNSTIFAYGQTGSGKSFTMTGTDTELGIIPCAVDGVFDAINAEPDRAFLLRVSYIEIYNETLRDLLNFKKSPLKDDEKPAIHTSKGKVYVDPLVEEVVSSPQDIVNLLGRGNHGRKVGATDWNERSSRSHCVFTIVIESRPRDGESGDDIRLSRLNLIDLAGSEKAVSDLERRGEGKHINKSLLALREVINKLTDKKRVHVPYRDSKLTHLLENALGGDSNICVICTLSAEEEHCSETLETLKFAGRCSQVETQAKKNILLSDDRALIKAKDKEIEVLKKRLKLLADSSTTTATSAADSSEQITDLAESVASMEARKNKLHTQLAKLNNEILTSDILPRSATGFPMSPPKPKRRRISDMNFMAPGTPRQPVTDRRAVSGMIRVTEEKEMLGMTSTLESAEDVTKSFDYDRTIAALRRALASKEDELFSALARLAQLPEREAEIARIRAELERLQSEHTALQGLNEEMVADHDVKMREHHVQLESTRAELVATVNDKIAKVDQLESIVLDLRKSREDLVIEDQTRYDELQSQFDKAVAEREQLKGEAESARVALEAEQRMKGDLEREIINVKSKTSERIDRYKRDLDTVTSQQAEVQASLLTSTSRVQQLETETKSLRSELEQSRTGHTQLSQQLTAMQGEKDLADQGRKNALADLESYQKAAMASEAQSIKELRDEIKRFRKEKEEDAETARKEIEALREAVEEGKRERERAKKQAEDMGVCLAEAEKREAVLNEGKVAEEKRLKALLEELEAAKADVARKEDERRKEVEQVERWRKEAEEKAARVVELEEREANLRQSHSDATAREKELLADLEREKKTSAQAIEEEKAASAKAIEEERRKAEAAAFQSDNLKAQVNELQSKERQLAQSHADLLAREAQLVKDVKELQTTMSTKVEEEKRRASDFEKRLSTTKAELLQVQQQRDTASLRAVEDDMAKTNNLTAQITRLNDAIAQLQKDLEGSQYALAQEKNARRVAEAHVKSSEGAANKQVETISALEVDCTALRQAIDSMQRELDDARKQAALSAETATDLAKEIVELKNVEVSSSSLSRSRSRHTVSASDPTIPSNGVLGHLRTQALTSASTGSNGYSPQGMLMTKEREEIQRLEKVVEAQKVIIDEQREKIMMWAREIEQQREIVRALTESLNSSSPTQTTHHGSRRISHGRSKSAIDSPRPAGAGGATKKPFPSTFTAFNLALPTTPTPLPMHPSQFDNTSGKKGRRVTIDHDMNKLSESSKVNKARAMFERGDGELVSPTKTPVRERGHTRANSTLMQSAPRQRRP